MVVVIDSLDRFGRGVTRIDEKVCFVKGALVGEEVEIEILQDNHNYSIAEVTNFLRKSPDRVIPKCPYYNECGGCHLGEMSLELQHKFKEDIVKEEFKRSFKGLTLNYKGIVYGEPYNYRNKAVFHGDGINLGFFKEESHDLVNINECLLLDERINEVIPTIKKVNDCLVRVGNMNDEMLYGNTRKTITSKIGNKEYRISARSFFQVNDEITERLYDAIKEIVKEKKSKNVLDLYCGIGTIGIYISDIVDEVLGIEIEEAAVIDANYNKKLNSIENAKFICGDVSDKIDLVANKYDLVIVDPPRKGLTRNIIKNIKRIEPSTIIYVSCNKTSLARDLLLLEDEYNIESLKLFDMFPNTYHVECVVVLGRKGNPES